VDEREVGQRVGLGDLRGGWRIDRRGNRDDAAAGPDQRNKLRSASGLIAARLMTASTWPSSASARGVRV
jgi:hypothetical protein